MWAVLVMCVAMWGRPWAVLAAIETGPDYSIFRPALTNRSQLHGALLASPQHWISAFESKLVVLDTLVSPPIPGTAHERAQTAYLDLVASQLTGLNFIHAEYTIRPPRDGSITKALSLDRDVRMAGKDATYLGYTMVGVKRLWNIYALLVDVFKEGVAGDYLESGVWRGGSSIFARAVMKTHNQQQRQVFVCDSFAGLPPGDPRWGQINVGWEQERYLQVSDVVVAQHFTQFSLLDGGVVFVKGFFNASMPPLRKHINRLAVLRLDGDLYESTVDVLYHMYDKLAVGGYVIIDDWILPPARQACKDFLSVHGLNPKIVNIDDTAVYWWKDVDVPIQYWRYEQRKFV